LHCLAGAKKKPAEYFVNLSNAEIKRSDFPAAATAANDGLRIYPGDLDLMGNLLTAQTAMKEFAQAAETARARLGLRRDVHSLHEVAALHCKYADNVRELDWPLAIKNWLSAGICKTPRFYWVSAIWGRRANQVQWLWK
jgi:hypothetical protein